VARERKPNVAFYTQISLEADELRRKLQRKLGVTGVKLVEQALLALDEKLNAMEPAE
jgi:hypothetical protein